ncbi:MAG: AAA family ATPase, partial [Verrucomicrobiota bacterium]
MSDDETKSDSLPEVVSILARARDEVGKVIIGQREVIDSCLIAIFTGQHILLEGVPGVAKTLLVRTLAAVLGRDFGRIQFTPDLMPSDITGTNVFSIQEGAFRRRARLWRQDLRERQAFSAAPVFGQRAGHPDP